VGVDTDRRRLLIVHFYFGNKAISVPYGVTASVTNSDTYESIPEYLHCNNVLSEKWTRLMAGFA
jgi:hypothetical protein